MRRAFRVLHLSKNRLFIVDEVNSFDHKAVLRRPSLMMTGGLIIILKEY
jgi:hypothetical protein